MRARRVCLVGLAISIALSAQNAAVDHAALRDRIEQLLPNSRETFDVEFPSLTSRIAAGFPARVKLSRPAEAEDLLTVTVGVGVACGEDDAVYVYDYGQGARRRVLESRGSRGHDESVSDVIFSRRDVRGTRLIL